MVFINYAAMQMTAKIVYYGPGLCGKTTNLQAIHQKTAPQSRGEMVSLETETDRTLFFDLLPLEVGIIGGMKVRLQLYTVPGQVFYNATRKLVLKGVDGIVFVADSQLAALDANVESLGNLHSNLKELGMSLDQVPLILQYNKRDLHNIHSVENLNEVLNPGRLPQFEAAALHGVGVFETLKAVSKLAITSIRKKIAAEAAPRKEPAAVVPAPVPPTPVAPHPPAHVLELLVSAAPAPEQLPVEFAEQDTGETRLRAVKTQGSADIQHELERIRAAAAYADKAALAPTSRPLDRRLQDLLAAETGARQDVKRKAGLEVPSQLLKGSSTVKVHLTFDGDHGREQVVRDAVTVKLGANHRLERLTLHLELEIKGKP